MTAQIWINIRNYDAIENDDSDRFYWDIEIPGFNIRAHSLREEYLMDHFQAD